MQNGRSGLNKENILGDPEHDRHICTNKRWSRDKDPIWTQTRRRKSSKGCLLCCQITAAKFARTEIDALKDLLNGNKVSLRLLRRKIRS